MKQKIFLVILLALLTAGSAQAQQHALIRLGGGVTSLYGRSTNVIGAFNIGMGYEYEFNQKWSVTPSLLYFSKGWKEKDQRVPARNDKGELVYDPETGQQLFGVKSIKAHANYLQLPITANYYIHLTSPHYISLSAGPYVAIGLGGKTETYGDTDRKGAERVYYEQDTFGHDRARRLDAGLTLAVGYEYDHHINLGLNADLGLLKVNKTTSGRNATYYLSFMYRL